LKRFFIEKFKIQNKNWLKKFIVGMLAYESLVAWELVCSESFDRLVNGEVWYQLHEPWWLVYHEYRFFVVGMYSYYQLGMG
jgi:hypothetical protein